MKVFPNSFLRKCKKLYLNISKSGIKYGNGVQIDFRTKIQNCKNQLTLEDQVYLRSIKRGYQAAMPYPTTILIDVAGARIHIGKNTRINGAYLHAQESIVIGKNCVIASGVNIIDSNGHELYSNNRTIGRDIPREIVIEDNVWIGLNCIILKDTFIGKNSVVSAGSVVKGNYPPNSLLRGNIAQVVRKI